jgi:hypothetical protein
MNFNPIEIRMPNAYRRVLLRSSTRVVDGYRLLGLVGTADLPSIIAATLHLRQARPDRGPGLTVISLDGTRALCLDCRQGEKMDCDLIEVDLTSRTPDRDKLLGKTFGQWLREHEAAEGRFRLAWRRVRARQAESKGRRTADWSAVVNRVRDYIVGLAAFRYNFVEGCLEVDEFCPIDQPHVKRGEATKALLNEVFARARDYGGSLKVMFTKDGAEDEQGESGQQSRSSDENREAPFHRRKPTPVPPELVALAKDRGVELPNDQVQRGIVSHTQAVEMWLGCFNLPAAVTETIHKLHAAGIVPRELLLEAMARGVWTKEELVWLFLNATRPEAVLLGTDLPENRPYYFESLSHGRAALLATRFKEAVMAQLTGGLSLEEVETSSARCALTPEGEFWVLTCNQPFDIPRMWMLEGKSKRVELGRSVILLCRPCYPTQLEEDARWISNQVEQLSHVSASSSLRCLILSHEFASPDYNKNLPALSAVVKQAERQGVTVLFAPGRMDLYLDETLHQRMRSGRLLKRFRPRTGPLALQVIQIPGEWWCPASGSSIRRGLRNASLSAEIFAQGIIQGRDIDHYRLEFSTACEVVEREAIQNHPVVAELQADDGQVFLDALTSFYQENWKGVVFPFVRPAGILRFRGHFQPTVQPSLWQRLRLGRQDHLPGLWSLLKKIAKEGAGIVIVPKPYGKAAPLPVHPAAGEDRDGPFILPEDVRASIDEERVRRKKERTYACSPQEVDRAHEQLRCALAAGLPLGATAFDAPMADRNPRPHVFVEMIRDYIFARQGVKSRAVRIAYGDGTEGEPFPLFSLESAVKPSGEFFPHAVGLVSLRHMSADGHTEGSLIANREIQRKETSAQQEALAYTKAIDFLEEILGFITGRLKREKLSHGLKALLLRRPELAKGKWAGLNLHVFHTTGLAPATIGTYRAVVNALAKHRGRLIVVPRILSSRFARQPQGEPDAADYLEAEPWY